VKAKKSATTQDRAGSLDRLPEHQNYAKQNDLSLDLIPSKYGTKPNAY